jgi:uncharacterized protein (DUF4415 family)
MGKRSPAFKSDFVKIDRTRGEPDAALPEATDADLDRAVYSVGGTVLTTPRRRGRPAGTGRKEFTTIRFDRDVVAKFRAMGRGWQTRMNDALREWLEGRSGRNGRRRRVGE